METLKQALLTYIESLTHYEISRFLQFYPQLVEDAEYFAKYTPMSVYDDTDDVKNTEIIKSILETVEQLLNQK